MRLLVLKKIDLGHALEMLEIGYLLIMRASVMGRQQTSAFGQKYQFKTTEKYFTTEPQRFKLIFIPMRKYLDVE